MILLDSLQEVAASITRGTSHLIILAAPIGITPTTTLSPTVRLPEALSV